MIPAAKLQGQLDGLCGVYAIVNALQVLQYGYPENIFQTCCESLPRNYWPSVLWEGTSFDDLWRMLNHCQSQLHLTNLTVSRPFAKKRPPSSQQFWEEFGELFRVSPSQKSAIIGLAHPTHHWLVARPKGRVLTLIDSDPLASSKPIERGTVYAGERRQNSQPYRITREDVILFERTQ